MNVLTITLQILEVTGSNALAIFCYKTKDLTQIFEVKCYGRNAEFIRRCGEGDIIQVIGGLWQEQGAWVIQASSVVPADPLFPVNQMCLIATHGSEKYKRLYISDTGKSACSFGVASNKTKDSPPTWFYVKAWDKTAEIVSDYTMPGSRLGITGYLILESATTGGCYLKIIATQVDLLSRISQPQEEPEPVSA